MAIKKVFGIEIKGVKPAINDLKKLFESIKGIDKTEASIQKVIDILAKDLPKSLEQANPKWKSFGETLTQVATSLDAKGIQLLSENVQKLSQSFEEFDGSEKSIEKIVQILSKDLPDGISKAVPGWNKLGKAMQEVSKSLDPESIGKLSGSIQQLGKELKNFDGSEKSVKSLMQLLTKDIPASLGTALPQYKEWGEAMAEISKTLDPEGIARFYENFKKLATQKVDFKDAESLKTFAQILGKDLPESFAAAVPGWKDLKKAMDAFSKTIDPDGVVKLQGSIEKLSQSFKKLKDNSISAKDIVNVIVDDVPKSIAAAIPGLTKISSLLGGIDELNKKMIASLKSDKLVFDKKGFIDIDATKQNLSDSLNALHQYKNQVKKELEDIAQSYNLRIAAAKDDKDAIEKLTLEKEERQAEYADKLKKIDNDIIAAEEDGNNLRLKQWVGFAGKVGGIAQDVADKISKISKGFDTAVNAVQSIYQGQIKAIDESVSIINEKLAANQTQAQQYTTNIEQYEADLVTAQKENNQELAASLQAKIESEKKSGQDLLINSKALEEEKQKLEEKKKKKEAQLKILEKIQKKLELAQNIGESTANIAQGVAKALAYGPILGPILAAIVAAAGAVQIGIMTKQLAKFEDGGLLRGKRHTHGGMRIEGTNIEVEGGEYVINRESTNKNLPLVRYINAQRKQLTAKDIDTFFTKNQTAPEQPFRRMFESGGELPTMNNSVSIDNEALVDAIKSIKFAPKVAVTDIIRAQDQLARVDGWTGM